ncbi:hypothetical protein ES707_15229 [subsurface metagenome]
MELSGLLPFGVRTPALVVRALGIYKTCPAQYAGGRESYRL